MTNIDVPRTVGKVNIIRSQVVVNALVDFCCFCSYIMYHLN